MGHHSRKDEDCTYWRSRRPVIDLGTRLGFGPQAQLVSDPIFPVQKMLRNPTSGLVSNLQLPHKTLEYCQLPVSCSSKLPTSWVSSSYLFAASNSNLKIFNLKTDLAEKFCSHRHKLLPLGSRAARTGSQLAGGDNISFFNQIIKLLNITTEFT